MSIEAFNAMQEEVNAIQDVRQAFAEASRATAEEGDKEGAAYFKGVAIGMIMCQRRLKQLAEKFRPVPLCPVTGCIDLTIEVQKIRELEEALRKANEKTNPIPGFQSSVRSPPISDDDTAATGTTNDQELAADSSDGF